MEYKRAVVLAVNVGEVHITSKWNLTGMLIDSLLLGMITGQWKKNLKGYRHVVQNLVLII